MLRCFRQVGSSGVNKTKVISVSRFHFISHSLMAPQFYSTCSESKIPQHFRSISKYYRTFEYNKLSKGNNPVKLHPRDHKYLHLR